MFSSLGGRYGIGIEFQLGKLGRFILFANFISRQKLASLEAEAAKLTSETGPEEGLEPEVAKLEAQNSSTRKEIDAVSFVYFDLPSCRSFNRSQSCLLKLAGNVTMIVALQSAFCRL